MKIKWNDETTEVYNAVIWVDGDNLLLDEYYTTKVEAVKAVITAKKNHKGKGELDCYVRYHDYWNDIVKDYEI